MSVNLVGLIIAKNEEKNIASAIKSLTGVDEIYVVDSFSTDDTIHICESLGCKVTTNKFVSHSSQVNFALKNIIPSSSWVLRLDADEILQCPVSDIRDLLNSRQYDESGFFVRRSIKFCGRLVERGFLRRRKTLRLFKAGKALSTEHLMDERLEVDGLVSDLPQVELIDDDSKGFDYWLEKHSNYSKREAVQYLLQSRYISSELSPGNFDLPWNKKIYYFCPPIARSFFYFFLRLFVGMGIFDRREASYYHLFQCLVYRILVDFRLLQLQRILVKGKRYELSELIDLLDEI